MLRSSIPTKFQLTWGQNAGPSYINPVPFPTQIPVTPGRASFNDGFPPDCFIAVAAGGVPPFGSDMNGVLNEITSWDQWYQAGGPITFDGTFASQIGGYPNGAIVQSNVVPGNFYMSAADNNTTDPDSSSSGNWVPAPGLANTGDLKFRPTAEAIPGWVRANGQTIGNASSGGASLASPTAQFLYIWVWTNFSNTVCPVSGGRGANARADFAANKTIQLPQLQGIVPGGVDTMGGVASAFWNSVPITSGNTTTPGSVLGESLHTLTNTELPRITPSFSGSFSGSNSIVVVQSDPVVATGQGPNYSDGPGANQGPKFNQQTVGSIGSFTPVGSISGSVAAFGSGGAHNTVQRTILVTWYLKL